MSRGETVGLPKMGVDVAAMVGVSDGKTVAVGLGMAVAVGAGVGIGVFVAGLTVGNGLAVAVGG